MAACCSPTICVPKFEVQLAGYRDAVRNPAYFRATAPLEIDPCGVELSVKRNASATRASAPTEGAPTHRHRRGTDAARDLTAGGGARRRLHAPGSSVFSPGFPSAVDAGRISPRAPGLVFSVTSASWVTYPNSFGYADIRIAAPAPPARSGRTAADESSPTPPLPTSDTPTGTAA